MVIAAVNHYQLRVHILLTNFACPSASYHAILYLCITLIIIALFWNFSTQNLQMWKSATIVDFATHFTSSTFVLTTFWEYLIFPTQHEANILNFNSSDLSLDCTFAKITRIHKLCQGKFFTCALIRLPTAEAYGTISISHWFLEH